MLDSNVDEKRKCFYVLRGIGPKTMKFMFIISIRNNVSLENIIGNYKIFDLIKYAHKTQGESYENGCIDFI